MMVRVTSPRGWMALGGIGLLIAAFLYWSIFGTLSTSITAEGVLIRPGGLKTVHTAFSGSLSDIRVVENDLVKKGDVIAWLEQPELLEQIRQIKQRIELLKEAGSMTEETALQLAELEQKHQQLLAEYDYAVKVISPYTGKVVEVYAEKGQHVGGGSPVIRLETHEEHSDELIAVLYVPIHEGKQLMPGMDVRVSPITVKREEHGSLIGTIISVSELPATVQGMMTVLGNEGLVQELGRFGVSLEVRVSLEPSANTYSGYRWTTAEGPPIRLSSGTLVHASVTLDKTRPISLVVPQLN